MTYVHLLKDMNYFRGMENFAINSVRIYNISVRVEQTNVTIDTGGRHYKSLDDARTDQFERKNCKINSIRLRVNKFACDTSVNQQNAMKNHGTCVHRFKLPYPINTGK